jgi:CheY-like chemotaxis protein
MSDNPYILIVDDSIENLKVVSSYLKVLKYKIALAEDAKSAFKILKSEKIDLILMDIMMPGMDGFEACTVLKSDPETMDIPVIFLTAKIETDDIVKGFQTGGVDYITKPFRKEELFARINCHIKLKLVRDFLVNSEIEVRKSRDQYMKILFGLSKIIDREK